MLYIRFFCTCLSMMGLSSLCRGQSAPEQFIVNPYVLNVTDSSFQVLWESSSLSKGTILLKELEDDISFTELMAVASEKDYQQMHYLTVTGLKKGISYVYQALSISYAGDTLQGPVTPVTLPDYQRQAVSFTALGDTQGNPLVWGKIAKLMYAERPNFIIHVGDLVSYGLNQDDWTDEFFKPAAELLKYYPLYPVLGNHEMNATFYYKYFNYPVPPSTGKRTSEGLDGDQSFLFSNTIDAMPVVRKGNVLFVFVNTNKDILPGSDQYNKLEKILANSKDYWKIMVHHHPIYVSSQDNGVSKPADGDMNTIQLRELYEDYGVDLVLNGHIHQYERTEPIYRGRINRTQGVVYVTTGGGGGSQSESSSAKRWFDVKTKKINHFLSFNIWEDELRAQAIDTAGSLFDFWDIKKNRATDNPLLLTSSAPYFTDSAQLSIQNISGKGKVVYHIAGDDALHQTSAAATSIAMTKTTEITAWLVNDLGEKGRPITRVFKKLDMQPSLKKLGIANKIQADYYEGFFTKLPDFSKIEPLRSFVSDSLTLHTIRPRRTDHWAARFTGRFIIPKTDVYRLLLRSYDGSTLYIDGREVINNDGLHYEIFKEAFLGLEEGAHTFEMQYFDFTRRETLQFWMGPQSGDLVDFNDFLKP